MRIPAVRGRILDRNGVALAENRPTYNLSLYLEELHKAFDTAYAQKALRVRADLKQKQQGLRGEAESQVDQRGAQAVPLHTEAKGSAAASRLDLRSPATW